MKRASFSSIALSYCVAMAVAGCGGSGLPPATSQVSGTQRQAFHRFLPLDAVKAGIYASSYRGTSVIGFRRGYRRGRGPNCLEYVGPNRHINDIATDPMGNLIVPESAEPHEVIIYGGPGMCGPVLGTFNDHYGPPGSAASLDAESGTILLANLNRRGSIAVCTLVSGCTKRLTNSNITGPGTGVALAKNGDCWLTSGNYGSNGVAMTYWRGCTGSGEAATGFLNASTGGLSIDKHGNLVSVDWNGGRSGQLWVYSGCNPACKIVGGPFPLQGNPVYGALDAAGRHFGVIEEGLIGIVDIYTYSPTKLTYEYSFDTGIVTSDPLGFAYSPALNQ